MSDVNKINDVNLEAVSGGATTLSGFPVDKQGNVLFKDKQTGQTLLISRADWEWLKGKEGEGSVQAEIRLAEIPLRDIEGQINERHSPFRH